MTIMMVWNVCADFAKYLLLARLRLLDMGLSTAAMEAEREVSNPNPDVKDNEALAIWAKEKLEEYIETVSKSELNPKVGFLSSLLL